MFDTIRKKTHDYVDAHIAELEATCKEDPRVDRLVRYLIAYSDGMNYGSIHSTFEQEVGREIATFMWQINNLDLSKIANSYHFSVDWAASLNSFIGNFVYDDAYFDFKRSDFDGTYSFFYSNDDNNRNLSNPEILVEAAIANRIYYDLVDKNGHFSSTGHIIRVTATDKVDALLAQRE